MNKNAVKTLLSLYCLGLLSSISLMDFFSSLLALLLLFLFAIKKVKNQTPDDHPYILFTSIDFVFVSLFTIAGLGFLINGAPEAPWLTQILKFRWILVFYFLLSALYWIKPGPKILPYVWALCYFLGIYGVFQFFTGFDVFRPPSHSDPWVMGPYWRVSGFIGNPMAYAHALGMLVAFAFGIWIARVKESKTKQSILEALGIFILGISLILTMTRGIWIGCAFSIFIMTLISHRKMLIYLSLIGFIIGGTLYSTSKIFRERANSIIVTDKSYESNSNRIDLWKTNLDIWKENPIFGIGLGESHRRIEELHKKFGREGAFKGEAHNQFIDILANMGILGLLAYLTLMGVYLWTTIKGYRMTPILWQKGVFLGALGAQICLHISGLTESNFETSSVRQLFVFIMAVVFWLYHELKTKSEFSKKV